MKGSCIYSKKMSTFHVLIYTAVASNLVRVIVLLLLIFNVAVFTKLHSKDMSRSVNMLKYLYNV